LRVFILSGSAGTDVKTGFHSCRFGFPKSNVEATAIFTDKPVICVYMSEHVGMCNYVMHKTEVGHGYAT